MSSGEEIQLNQRLFIQILDEEYEKLISGQSQVPYAADRMGQAKEIFKDMVLSETLSSFIPDQASQYL